MLPSNFAYAKDDSCRPTMHPPNSNAPIECNLSLASQFHDNMYTSCASFFTNCALAQDFHQIALHTQRET